VGHFFRGALTARAERLMARQDLTVSFLSHVQLARFVRNAEATNKDYEHHSCELCLQRAHLGVATIPTAISCASVRMVRLFNHWFLSHSIMLVALDAVILFIVFMLGGAWLSRGNLGGADLLPTALLFAIAMVLLSSLVGLYRRDPYRTRVQTAARLAVSLLFCLPAAFVIVSLVPIGRGHYDALLITAASGVAVMVARQGIAGRRSGSPIFQRRVLVFGTGPEAAAVESSLRHFGLGMVVVGFYAVQNTDNHTVDKERVLTSAGSLLETANMHDVDDLIVAVRERRGGALPLNELLECKLSGVRVLDLSSYYERALGQVRLDTLHASWLIFGEGFRQGLLRTVVKRVFDVIASLVLLVLGCPVMLITAAGIAVESGFPVLYRQDRIGRAGRVIQVIKFRSMRKDAEQDGKPQWAVSNDERITRIGKLIRKLRIDEMPQLINVLKGDMSLVGPRPERPYFVDKLTREIPFYAARHSVKPGITGWAQVRYHYGASVDDSIQKLQYDLYYVKNHSLFLDIVVLFETVGVVVTGEGAQ
jgi:sugar transferase (PEP-CTERM system associated)